MKLELALALMAASASAQVPATNQVCTSNCPIDITHQTATSGATASHTNSSASQAGNSTASNASGVTVSPIVQSTTGPQTQSLAGSQSASAANNGNTNSTGASTSNAHTGDNTNSLGATGGVSRSDSAANGGAGGSAAGGTSSASGGASSVGTVSSGSSNGSQSLTTGSTTSNTNVSEKTTFIPSMLPQTPVVQLAGSGIDKEVLACGPRQVVIHHPVTQTMAGLFHDHHIDVGETDDLVPYDGDPYIKVPLDDGRDGYEMYGDQPILYTTVLGAASGRSIGGGGTTAGQASGQLGFGWSSSVQRMVTSIKLVRCFVGTAVREPKPMPTTTTPVPTPVPWTFPSNVTPFVGDLPPAPKPSTPVHRRHKRVVNDCKQKEKN